MAERERTYIAIDLKSFYASVECMERKLDPLTTNLVVADESRTEKTICLAVSPSLKAYGISGRARLFEVVQRVKEVNALRRRNAPGRLLSGSSADDLMLRADPSLAVDYIVAPPRMALYMERSTEVYQTYLRFVAPEDIHVYSIDEVFMDVTDYLDTYGLTARELAREMIRAVFSATGITATAGIGTNLYLAKLWSYRPLTHIWRVGPGYAKRLEEQGLFTMGDIARCSIGKRTDYYNEELLYRMFGVNAELLIDHAWGWEPCTMKEIKAYKPENSSIGSGQVLTCPYPFQKARLVVREMADLLALDLVDKGLVTDQIVLTVGYASENLTDREAGRSYKGPVTTDRYGRKVPKHAHGTENLERKTSSTKQIVEGAMALFDRIVDPELMVRRVYITACRIMDEAAAHRKEQMEVEQLDLFTDYGALEERRREEEAALAQEKKLQQAMLEIKKRFGKGAVLKGMSLEEGATARERSRQIGGHKA